jgi:7-cyano-7-deazaguanine synthase
MEAIVLLSGGVDSTTCLAEAVARFGPGRVLALTIFYGQKHAKEIEAAKQVCAFYGVEQQIQDISAVFALSDCPLLEGSTQAIDHASYGEQLEKMGGRGTVSTYVPFRNGLFLSYAAAIALVRGAHVIMYGAHADDACGDAYPDCTIEFVQSMGKAIWEGSGKQLSLEAPFVQMSKAGVVARGLALKAPYELTWSCYEGGDRPCGTCGTCRDRAAAFAANGIADPALNR